MLTTNLQSRNEDINECLTCTSDHARENSKFKVWIN